MFAFITKKNSISISSNVMHTTTKRLLRYLHYPTRQIVMSVRANFIDIFIYRECVAKVCEAERNWREYMKR